MVLLTGAKIDNIMTWLICFESIADSCNSSEMQKFIFVQRAFNFLALFFARSGSNRTSCSALKKALLLEFGESSSATQIYPLLAA